MNKYWFAPNYTDDEDMYFECGKGWYPIIVEAFDKFLALNLSQDEEYPFRIQQVKEKWGGLRIYTSYTNDDIEKIIDEAEDKAEKTCEFCGMSDSTVDNRNIHGWYSTTCYPCYRTEIERTH